MLTRRTQQFFQFVIVDSRNHRGGNHGDRNAGLAQCRNRFQPGVRRTGPGFELAGQRAIQRGQRNRNLAQFLPGEFDPQVDVAADQR